MLEITTVGRAAVGSGGRIRVHASLGGYSSKPVEPCHGVDALADVHPVEEDEVPGVSGCDALAAGHVCEDPIRDRERRSAAITARSPTPRTSRPGEDLDIEPAVDHVYVLLG